MSVIYITRIMDIVNTTGAYIPWSKFSQYSDAVLQPPKALLAHVNSNTQLSQGHIPIQLADQKAALPVAHQPSLHRSFDETSSRITNIQNDLNSPSTPSKLTKDRNIAQGPSAMVFQVPLHTDNAARYPYTTLNRPSDTDSEEDWELPDILGDVGTCDAHFDKDGNFYGRGKDLFIGPRANPGDIDKFLIAAGNAEQFDGNASVDKALEKLGLKSLYDFLTGMAISLLAHQIIGVAWATREMWRQGRLCKTNLIVAPLALLDQWKLEIEMKTTNNLQCLVYHGCNESVGELKHTIRDIMAAMDTHSSTLPPEYRGVPVFMHSSSPSMPSPLQLFQRDYMQRLTL
ncbi:hypothetical protein EV702DRAFT_1234778 [Suillus placidus]|uniref:Uncharacterized protein n=1 Tax=Suillus placidus TaxID=48579 RepID=A0A9P6ZS27_9AGAM|nr:hypothetical protein EV702DRAFT_1234778 [Suillus placidus]